MTLQYTVEEYESHPEEIMEFLEYVMMTVCPNTKLFKDGSNLHPDFNSPLIIAEA